MEYLKIDGQHFYNMVVNASNKLEEQKEYVNTLNIFPVPDGDTGTNMSMTFRAAVLEIEDIQNTSIGEVSKRLAKGALMGARGNSGVILSQIFRGIAKGLENKDEVDVVEFAGCFIEGAKSAYKAVMRPTEGTILTIIKAAGEAADKSVATNIVELLAEICEYSEEMLNKTPDMLPVLKKAKVVDAGGMGLLIILKGMYAALESNIEYKIAKVVERNEPSVMLGEIGEEEIKYGYCTELLIKAKNVDMDNLRKELEQYGDSLIAVEFEDVIKIHVHTNDPGLVLTRGIQLGELSKIKIENMREQHRHLLIEEESIVSKEEVEEEPKEYAFISIAMGEGIKNIFEDLGVDSVIEGGQTMNPSTQDILDRINKINAKTIFVLPNNKNIIMAASQAVDLTEDKKVVVIKTKTIPQGITAITAFNPDETVEGNIGLMESAIATVVTGQVTYAVRDTEMEGKNIKEGNILGLVESQIKEVGSDIYQVSEQILENMITKESELITLFYGKDCDAKEVEIFASKLEIKYPDFDIQCYNGQQPLYYFIIAVE